MNMITQENDTSVIPEFWYSEYLNESIIIFDYPASIIGETGTCRSFIAEAIHNLNPERCKKPFITEYCSAVENESHLFEVLNSSNGGTVFLDEITELSDNLQLIVSAYIDQNQTIRKGDQSSSRIIVGAKEDLKPKTNKGNLIDKLYYNLTVLSVKIGPLRKRKQLIIPLVEHILEFEIKRNNLVPISINNEVLQVLTEYTWPGNLTQLQQAIKHAIANCKHCCIYHDNLPPEISSIINATPKRGPTPKLTYETVIKAIKTTGGNKAKAAKLLSVGRATLYRYLDKHSDL